MQSKMGAGLPRVATSGYIDGVAQGKGEMKMRMRVRVRVRECHRVYVTVCDCVSVCVRLLMLFAPKELSQKKTLWQQLKIDRRPPRLLLAPFPLLPFLICPFQSV